MVEELKATEALLDIGVSVPLRPLRFRKWKITPRVTIKRPPLGGLLRILRLWLPMNVQAEEIEKMTERERQVFIEKNGKDVTKMVALMVCSGFMTGKLFSPILAVMLHWRCHPDTLLLTTVAFMQLLDTKSFMNITRSVSALNVAAPRLGQKKKRS